MKQLLITIAAVVLVGCGNREASYDLMMATGVGQIDNVKQAINDGANVNARVPNGTLKGYTMLDLAIRNGHTETAALLRKHGAKTAEELDTAGN
jgi:ankyrin repeat protein